MNEWTSMLTAARSLSIAQTSLLISPFSTWIPPDSESHYISIKQTFSSSTKPA